MPVKYKVNLAGKLEKLNVATLIAWLVVVKLLLAFGVGKIACFPHVIWNFIT